MAQGRDVALDPVARSGLDGSHRTSVDGPAKGIRIEGAGGRLVLAADFEVNHGMIHPSPEHESRTPA